MRSNNNILIIGTGSIAKRHTKNIINLFNKKKYDVNIFIFSKRFDRAKKFTNFFSKKMTVLQKEKEIKKIKFDYIFIVTDISSHIKWLKFFKKGKTKIFCEKPLVIEKKDIIWLENNINYYKKVFVGFQYKFSPITIKLKSILKKKSFGNLLTTTFETGQDIRDWRKGTDYKKEFAFGKIKKNKKSLIWELCHDIDLMFYLVGTPLKVYAQESKINYKKLETKDFFHFVGTHKNNSKTIISQNMFSPILYKKINFIYEQALINVDYVSGKIEIKSKNKKNRLI